MVIMDGTKLVMIMEDGIELVMIIVDGIKLVMIIEDGVKLEMIIKDGVELGITLGTLNNQIIHQTLEGLGEANLTNVIGLQQAEGGETVKKIALDGSSTEMATIFQAMYNVEDKVKIGLQGIRISRRTKVITNPA